MPLRRRPYPPPLHDRPGTRRLRAPNKTRLDELPANQGTVDVKESPMDVSPSFIANPQPPIPVQLRGGPLHNPPIVAQFFRTVDPPSGHSRRDPPLAQPPSLVRRIIGLVGMQLLRALSGPTTRAPDRFHGLDGFLHHPPIMPVGRRDGHGQRDAVFVDPQMALCPLLAAIRLPVWQTGRSSHGPSPSPGGASPKGCPS